jgi:hypothetical protein
MSAGPGHSESAPEGVAVTSRQERGEASSPQLLRFEGRLLYPFTLAKGALQSACEALTRAPVLARESAEPSRWARREPRKLYTQEIHPHVVDFLFPGGHEGFAYLEMAPEASERWLRGVQVVLGREEAERPEIKAGRSGIELFLSDFGVGVLSIGIAITSKISPELIASVLSRMAQLHSQAAVALHVPHPSEAPNAKIDLSRVKPAPAEDAPLASRVGARGGTFRLEELVRALLASLDEPRFEFTALQTELASYAVLVFDPACDFSDEATRERLAPVLSGLAQLEGATHAGASLETLVVDNAVLNRKHWAGASMLASVHLLADQPPPPGRAEHPFNTERVPRALFKYFAVFLVAMMQRLILQRVLEEAGAMVRDEGKARTDLRRLRTRLLEFAIRGHFTQVSRRGTVQRFYRVSQDAMDVPETFASSRSAIADLDARTMAEAEADLVKMQAEALGAQVRLLETNAKLASESATSQRTLVRMQYDLELLEVFIVGFYSVHLAHILFFEGAETHHKCTTPAACTALERVAEAAAEWSHLHRVEILLVWFAVAMYGAWKVVRGRKH